MPETIVSSTEGLGPVLTDVDGKPVQVLLVTDVLKDDDTGVVRARSYYRHPNGTQVIRGWLSEPIGVQPRPAPTHSAPTPYVDLDPPFQAP
jgi:hypothetical protein